MNDFLTDYLQSLHGIPVLNHEEEYELAARIAGGECIVRHLLHAWFSFFAADGERARRH